VVKKRIFFAFVVVAVVPAVITILAANMFARQELEEIRRRNATTGLARLDANVVEDLAAMGSAVKNEVADPRWRRLFLRRWQLGSVFQAQVIDQLVERSAQAGWIFSAIIDTAGVVLGRGDRPSSFGDTVDYRTVFGTHAITKATASAVSPFLPVWGTGGLLGIAPITYDDKTLAFLLVGKPFTADNLRNWVGGWAIPAMIVASGEILNLTPDVPQEQISPETFSAIYNGPPVTSMNLTGRRFLIGRKHLTVPNSGKAPLMMLLFFDSAPVDAATAKLFYAMLAAGGLGLLLALLFGGLVARLLTRPLDDIVEAANRISDGQWDADVISFSGGDAGRMADAFNRMIRDLRRSRDRLIQTERLGAWRDAARKVAHEIKNPLSPIQVSAEDLVSAYKPDDPGFEKVLKQSTATIIEEVAAIKRFVDEFSSFARTPQPVFARFDIKDLLRDAASSFPTENRDGRIAVDTTRSLTLTGDAELLKQALVNLIKNGLEAGGAKGAVTVTVVDEDDQVQIIVDDTGPGISGEMKEKLFTPYATGKPGGTGLGLVIVQGIAFDHGGTVAVRESPDGGARFVLQLLKNPPAREQR
jgi:signal transduction histidine kinase